MDRDVPDKSNAAELKLIEPPGAPMVPEMEADIVFYTGQESLLIATQQAKAEIILFSFETVLTVVLRSAVE
jgi:hypothetical protein